MPRKHRRAPEPTAETPRVFGAEARTVIGYASGHDDLLFFEGVRRAFTSPR